MIIPERLALVSTLALGESSHPATDTPLPVVATTATIIGLVMLAMALALQPLLWSDVVPSASVLAASRP